MLIPGVYEKNRRAIVPIGLMFSLSLICGNLAYLYLSVSFIQMLKATNAVVTLLATWAFGISQANLRTLGNVFLIVVGVAIASFGEIKFDMFGFLSMSPIAVLSCHVACLTHNPSPGWWYHLRGPALGHGPASPQLGRIQDGPLGVRLLLCPGLRDYQRCRHVLH